MMNASDFFQNAYGRKPRVVARAPGRLEILGNHTDYNEGLVLSAAVERATEFAASPVSGRTCRLRSLGVGEPVEFDVDDPGKAVPGDWSNYVKGVLVELGKRGISVGAFEAAVVSSVPLSAGMSSSAALEIAACFALRELFDVDLSNEEWARVGRGVENDYLGVKTGLLDQFSSIYGKKDHLIFCDFRDVAVKRRVPLPPGHAVVVANSMVAHDLVDSDYNQRFESCRRAVEGARSIFPDVTALRDVTPAMLDEARGAMSEMDYRRATHVVEENRRVLAAMTALDEGDVERFGELLFESHQSSRENFENSCPELDYLVELAKSIPGCLGARLSGGGFGGITIHLVEEPLADDYAGRLKTAFKLKTGVDAEPIVCGIGDGASAMKVEPE